jgi:hypothetical protein
MTDETQGDEWDRIHEARIDRELEDKNMEGEKEWQKNSTYIKNSSR